MSVNYAVQDFAYIVPKQTLKKQPGILLAPPNPSDPTWGHARSAVFAFSSMMPTPSQPPCRQRSGPKKWICRAHRRLRCTFLALALPLAASAAGRGGAEQNVLKIRREKQLQSVDPSEINHCAA
jgi:hypothetical protein